MDLLEKFTIGTGVTAIVVIAVILLMGLQALLVWWAWNTFMVFMFGLKAIGFWQALALGILAGLVRGWNFNTNKK